MSIDPRPLDAAAAMLRGPLLLAGSLLDAVAEGARVYWSFWGPLGEPAIAVVEICADAQRRYLGWWTDAVGQYRPPA
jgi:hypothetical protein